MAHKVLVASYSSSVVTLDVDVNASPPTLRLASSLEVGHHPSWIAQHPDDPSLLFTVLEQTDGTVKALRYDLTSGEGRVVGEAKTDGADPCHCVVLGQELIVANYSGGSVSFVPLSDSAPYLSAPRQTVEFSGTGPITSRQEGSHPHQVVPHPLREEVFIPDLGSDKVWRLAKDGEGWAVKGDVPVEPGTGPRHAVIRDTTLYTLGELSNTLTTHKIPALPDAPVLLHKTFTLSDPPADPTSIDPPPLSAEILLLEPSPLTSSAQLFVTNRNDPHAEGDVLAVFEPDPSGAPTLVNEVRTGLTHLRGVAFHKSGRWLLAGGTFGRGVKLFERLPGGREFREVAHLPDVQNPTGFLWL